MPVVAAAAIAGGTALIGGKMQSDAAKKQAQAATSAANTSDQTMRYIFDQTRADNALGRQVGDAAQRRLASLMGLNLGNSAGSMPVNALNPAYASMGGGVSDFANGYVAEATPQSGGYGFGGETLAQVPQNATAATAQAPQSMTDWLRSTPGYDFNFKEGVRGMNLALANRGQLLSGDAAREAQRFGQNYGDRIFNQERNALFNLAGFGQVANANNQQAGQSYASGTVNNAWNRANALGSSYQNSANAWTNALGGVAGAGLWAMGR